MKGILMNALEKLLVVLVGVITIDVIWQVASRYIFNNPSSFTDELAGFLLIWLGLFGAAYVTGRDEHLAIDILPQKLEGKQKRRLQILIYGLVIIFALAVMVVGGINLVYLTFLLEQKSASLQVPLGFVYISIPLSGILICYFSLESILNLQPAKA
ncbi:MAG: TRAP transporter small permease [Bacteroidota bacterium]